MRSLVISSVVLFAACECAQVPDDVCLIGECDGGNTSGGGGTTGGGTGITGGGGGGTATGGGGGAGTGGDGGGTGGGAVVPDAGVQLFCETWRCVELSLPERRTSRPTFTVNAYDVPDADAGCTPLFSGGVLMPDDSVILVPACARHFVRVDVMSGAATNASPEIPTLRENGAVGPFVPSFAGGVLDCAGNVVAFPLGNYALTRLTPAGNLEHFNSSTVSHGGVLRGTCSDAGVAMPSGNYQLETYTFGTGVSTTTATGRSLEYTATMRGCYRRGVGDAECLFSGRPLLALGVATRGYVAGSTTGSFTDFGAFSSEVAGAAITRSGDVVIFNANTGESYLHTDTGGVRRSPDMVVDAGAVSWPASRGDGYIYAMGKHGLWVLDEDGDAGAELHRIRGYEALTQPFMGLVGHPSGALVVVPAESDQILILRPDVPHLVPGRVLRAPFFNKL